MAPPWKGGLRVTASRVRIPLPPPEKYNEYTSQIFFRYLRGYFLIYRDHSYRYPTYISQPQYLHMFRTTWHCTLLLDYGTPAIRQRILSQTPSKDNHYNRAVSLYPTSNICFQRSGQYMPNRPAACVVVVYAYTGNDWSPGLSCAQRRNYISGEIWQGI